MTKHLSPMKKAGGKVVALHGKGTPDFDWDGIARTIVLSRTLDAIEEKELLPQKKIVYQFSARGHELAQVLLGSLLNNPCDAITAYYRSRPILLELGVTPEEAFAAPMGKLGTYSDGRDIGVVCNLPSRGKATVLPMGGDVGAQFTPAIGWASGIRYRHLTLGETEYRSAIAVALGGDGSVATNGFWSAITIATTEKLPILFFIEDNGYSLSVPGSQQTPGGDIVKNLSSFNGLQSASVDGTDPELASVAILKAVHFVRGHEGPYLLRVTVPRLCGHSGQDTQAYRPRGELEREHDRDPLPKLKEWLVPKRISAAGWDAITQEVSIRARDAIQRAVEMPDPDPTTVYRGMFEPEFSEPGPHATANPSDSIRVNMQETIRRTLESELRRDPRILVFGEDVAAKGGVHAVTAGLHDAFGGARVFDTSLSEEGIIGRAVGMALMGLRPVAELQFRKYADPAAEQLANCGTMRWRTAGKFSAPIVVRVAGGFSRRAGDPWHSESAESEFIHAFGWQVVMPSNAEDAVGLLRQAMRSQNPTLFFEHRALLDAPTARRPYPGDDFILPFGKARVVSEGTALSVITWGAMVERCEEAAQLVHAEGLFGAIEILDLRTLMPWDREGIIASVRKTSRCLIVHEDTRTLGFGAEIAATLAEHLFAELDAPVRRVAPADIPIPFHPILMNEVVPSVEVIRDEMLGLLNF